MTKPEPLCCVEFVELVTDWLEGALTAFERTLVDDHLAACEACTTYLDQMRQTISMLATLADDDPAAILIDRLLIAFGELHRRRHDD